MPVSPAFSERFARPADTVLRRALQTLLCRRPNFHTDSDSTSLTATSPPTLSTSRRGQSLPVELWLLVCAHLDYFDLGRLRRVNRFLRQVVAHPANNPRSFHPPRRVDVGQFLMAHTANSVELHPFWSMVEHLAIDSRGRRVVKLWRARRPVALDDLGPVLYETATSPPPPRLFVGERTTLHLLQALYSPWTIVARPVNPGGVRVGQVLDAVLTHAVLRLPIGKRTRPVKVGCGVIFDWMRVSDEGHGWVGLLASP